MCTRIWVVDHVGGTVLLSHLKMEDTVERLPSRHLALSLCTEDVKAQCEAMTLKYGNVFCVFCLSREPVMERRTRLLPFLCVYRDVTATSETKNDLSEQSHNPT